MTGHFERLSRSVLRGLLEERRCDGRLLALRYALYCLSFLAKEGYTQTDFFSLIIRVLGNADGFFVIGLSLLDDDEEAALQAFEAALEARVPAVHGPAARRGPDAFLDEDMTAALEAMVDLIRKERSRLLAGETARGKIRRRPPVVFQGQLELF
jgi:hypothetical protein